MSQSPEISVIMPVHNAGSTVGSSLRSLLWSLPKNSEILIFLDGCSDNSEEVIRSFQSSKVRILKSEFQVGVASALNALLAEAKGLYVARMDADDICLPWRFWGYKKKLEQADFVFSSQINFSPKRAFFVRQPFIFPLNNVEITEILKETNTLVHSSLVAKKATLTNLGGYVNVPAEDYNLWLRALIQGKKFRKTWIPKILFRVHDKQLTKTWAWKEKNQASEENKLLLNELRGQEHTEKVPRKIQSLYLALLKSRVPGGNGKTDKAYFLSLLDSTVWRSSTLVISLAIAAICSIEEYALYAAGAFATTFFQGLVEGSLRMLQVNYYSDQTALRKLRKLSGFVLLFSILFLSMTLAGISFLFTGSLDSWLALAPFVVALPLIRISTLYQLILQSAGMWKVLVKFRILAVLAMLLIMLPTLLQTRNIVVGSFALALSEVTFAILAKRRAIEIEKKNAIHNFRAMLAQRKYTEAIETQVGLWIRSQLDRVLVVMFANPKVVGLYFLAYTIARTPSETLSAGATRRLKSIELEDGAKSSFVAIRKNITLIQLSSLGSIIVFLGIERNLLGFFPTHWSDVIKVIPLFIVATLPASMSSALFEYNFRNTRNKKRWSLYVISFMGAGVVSVFLNLVGLVAAAYALIFKEVFVSLYWYKSSKIPKGTLLGFQTLSLTLASFLISALTFLI